MDDDFLHSLRREPDPGYARALREQLRALEDAPTRGFRLQPVLAGAAAVALLAGAFTIPAVRVAAQSALDLFRVRSFAAVEVDEAHLEQLRKFHEANGNDPTMMVFDQQEKLQDPGPPVEYASAALAAAAAGMPGLRQPGSLPGGLKFEKAAVNGEGRARLTLHADRLQHVLDALGITDVHVPMAVDGQKIAVHMPASVMQWYTNGKRTLTVIEGNSPEVALPPGADLRQLGEIGLRVLGLDADEARRTAAGIDWRSTFLVPVPSTATTFRHVDVNGHKGLFIRSEGNPTGPEGQQPRGAMVLWTEGDRVFAVQSNLSSEDVLEVAQSLH